MNDYRIELIYGANASVPSVVITVEAASLEEAKARALSHGPTVRAEHGLDRCEPIEAKAA